MSTVEKETRSEEVSDSEMAEVLEKFGKLWPSLWKYYAPVSIKRMVCEAFETITKAREKAQNENSIHGRHSGTEEES